MKCQTFGSFGVVAHEHVKLVLFCFVKYSTKSNTGRRVDEARAHARGDDESRHFKLQVSASDTGAGREFHSAIFPEMVDCHSGDALAPAFGLCSCWECPALGRLRARLIYTSSGGTSTQWFRNYFIKLYEAMIPPPVSQGCPVEVL